MNSSELRTASDLISKASRVVSFSGAGLSAESGVATFRDANTQGVWTKFDPMKLASPQGFQDDPKLVIDWYADRRRYVAQAQPNAAHVALASRGEMQHITQNVDDLLIRAGVDPDILIQLHGTIASDHCHDLCGYEEAINLSDPPSLHACPRCGGSMRPSVVWFGESLLPEAWNKAEQACIECDVLLVIGTSAEVYPAAGLLDLSKSNGATIIIVNTESSGASHLADLELTGNAGEIIPHLLR
ncbi:MAG: NAD-dependent protein deacylase [Planctomycetota bacterium]|nr:NAD-dependent protein deacylase [Planctomycetota bacterium]